MLDMLQNGVIKRRPVKSYVSENVLNDVLAIITEHGTITNTKLNELATCARSSVSKATKQLIKDNAIIKQPSRRANIKEIEFVRVGNEENK